MNKEDYRDKKPIAVYPMTNWGGIVILDLINGVDDEVVTAYDFGDGYDGIEMNMVQYDDDDEPYFVKNGLEVYLSECMRTGY